MADRRIRPSVVEDQHDPLPGHRLVRPDHAHMRTDDHGQLQRFGRLAARQILPVARLQPRGFDLQGFLGVDRSQLPLRPHQLPFELRFRRNEEHPALREGRRRAGHPSGPHGGFGLGALQHDVFGLADDVPGLLPRLDAGYGLRPGLPRCLGRAAGQFERQFLRQCQDDALDGRLPADDEQQTLYGPRFRAETRLHHQRALAEGQRLAEHLLFARLPGGEQRESDVLH